MEAAPAPDGPRRLRRVRRWAVLGALVTLALVLGAVGFERLPEGKSWSFADSLIRSIQLFVLEGNNVDPPVPWQLEIARFLAPATTAYAAVLAALALFRDELRQLAVRLRARDHAVVAGLGSKGFRLARQLHAQGTRVVAIERDERNPAVAGCRERGIAVIVGDASDPRTLHRAALPRARHLFVVCGDDGANADVSFAAQRAMADAPRGPTAFVHLDDLDLWRHLKAHELATDSHPVLRTEFFNVADAGARLLLEHHPPFAPGATDPHVIVCGASGLGESLVLHAATRWDAERRSPGALLRVTLCGPGAAADRARLVTAQPRLEQICDVRAGDPEPGEPEATAAYVCLTPEARAASLALNMRANPALGAAPIVVAVRDESEGIATALRPSGGVTAFGYLNRVMSSDLIVQGTAEVLARAKHAQYVRDEQGRGHTAETNPSMVPWHRLEDSLQHSNRRFAEGVGAKLRAAGIAVLPAPLADPAATAGILPEEQVEELAIAEHDRWCQDLLADGWSRTDGPKDPERKLHPSLVPWDELSEEEREKDREPVRALPEMLARAGFELASSRSGSPAAAPSQSARPHT